MSYLIDVRNIESLQGIHEAFRSILQHSGFAAKIQEASAQGSHATPDVTPSPAPHREACSPSRSTASSLVPGHEIEIYQKTLLAIDQIFERSGLPGHEGNAEEALLTPGVTPSPDLCHDVRQQLFDRQEQSSALDNHPQRLDETFPSTSLLNTELGIPPRDINPLKRRRADFEDETEDDVRPLFEDDTLEPSQPDDVPTDSSTTPTSSSDSEGAPTETENSKQHDSGSTAQTENSKPNYVDPETQTEQTKPRRSGKNQRKPGPAPTFGEPEFTRLKQDLRIRLQPNAAQDFQNTQSILRRLRGRRLQPQKIQPSDSAYVSLRNCLEVYESKAGEASDDKLFYKLMHRVNLVQLAAEDERLAESLPVGGRSKAVDLLVDKLWETDAPALRHDDSKRKKVHNWNGSGRPLLALVRQYGYGALIAPGLRLGKRRLQDISCKDYGILVRYVEKCNPDLKAELTNLSHVIEEAMLRQTLPPRWLEIERIDGLPNNGDFSLSRWVRLSELPLEPTSVSSQTTWLPNDGNALDGSQVSLQASWAPGSLQQQQAGPIAIWWRGPMNYPQWYDTQQMQQPTGPAASGRQGPVNRLPEYVTQQTPHHVSPSPSAPRPHNGTPGPLVQHHSNGQQFWNQVSENAMQQTPRHVSPGPLVQYHSNGQQYALQQTLPRVSPCPSTPRPHSGTPDLSTQDLFGQQMSEQIGTAAPGRPLPQNEMVRSTPQQCFSTDAVADPMQSLVSQSQEQAKPPTLETPELSFGQLVQMTIEDCLHSDIYDEPKEPRLIEESGAYA